MILMPQYFFHVQLELLPPPGSPAEGIAGQEWSEGVESLAPFLKTESAVDRPYSASTEVPQKLAARKSLSHRDTQAPDPQSHQISDELSNLSPQARGMMARDYRLDSISIEGTDMIDMKSARLKNPEEEDYINKGIGTSTNGPQTKGRYVPLDKDVRNHAWGIVHLYRDVDETPGLDEDSMRELQQQQQRSTSLKNALSRPVPKNTDCTTLCILAVPSYMAPSDFLGFVGEESRNQISHFRMIRTARANRYMVLMKFRHGREARHWQEEWNGKVFNSMEPETCHVVFIKSVEITTPSCSSPSPTEPLNFPEPHSDPFTTNARTSKPLAPPTRSLIELPTCPVCLERMDETTGLLTILCQHVFHCTCLQKWSGGGCPVCRYTHDDFSSQPSSKSKSKPKYPKSHKIEDSELLECATCHSTTNLWQCLICGTVGCGRYDAAHAFAHFRQTGHTFAMDLESKRVWDYDGDRYVHRIAPAAPAAMARGKETPCQRDETGEDYGWDGAEGEDTLGLEYTHLLTSQLESQRVYFEEKVERAADKAARAVEDAAQASKAATEAVGELCGLKGRYEVLINETVPGLERENKRLEKKAGKFEELVRGMEKNWQEERSLGQGLKARIDKMVAEVDGLRGERDAAVTGRREAEEMCRDLQFFISGQAKVQEMEKGELLEEGEVREGTVSVPEQGSGKGKRKGKGKR